MFIVNQDRDELVELSGPLYTLPHIYNGIIMAINLYTSGRLLGSFDSVDEAMDEIDNIADCPADYYAIGGSMTEEEFEEVLFGGNEDENGQI